MARYTTQVPSTRTPSDAFAYMANLEHFADWDPGVRSATKTSGADGELGAAYDVIAAVAGRPLTLTYRVVDVEPGTRIAVLAETSWLKSLDTITVEDGESGGSLVTYDATLELRGVLGVFDVALRRSFTKICERALVGLRRVLNEAAS